MEVINKNKLFLALIFNALIVVLEIIALFLSINRHGINVFLYYTENSNYFSLIVSLIFCGILIYSLIKHKNLPKFIIILRYMATICLTITFLVVIFLLVPLKPSMASYLILEDSSLYQHVLCPILSVISFLIFEPAIRLNKREIIWGIIPTIIYGVIIITLNILKIIIGPYPFFYVYNIPWYLTVLTCGGIFTLGVAVAFIVLFVQNRVLKKRI